MVADLPVFLGNEGDSWVMNIGDESLSLFSAHVLVHWLLEMGNTVGVVRALRVFSSGG